MSLEPPRLKILVQTLKFSYTVNLDYFHLLFLLHLAITTRSMPFGLPGTVDLKQANTVLTAQYHNVVS